MNRLTTRHEVTRAALFSHLGCDPRLAALDLARGRQAVAAEERSAFDRLIERLAWAVQCDSARLEATFVLAMPDRMLPLRARQYGCAQCWLEAAAAGRPPVILREWVLRHSWYCSVHGALLVDLAGIRRGSDASPDLVRLRRLARGALTACETLEFAEERMLLNRHATIELLGQSLRGKAPGGLQAYLREFSGNRLHLVAARTVLLASAHCHDRRLPRRFAAMFSPLACPGATPPAVPMEGAPATLPRVAAAIRQIHRHRLRGDCRKLEAVGRRLSAFRYLASGDGNEPDWRVRAVHALGAECRRRRSRDEALRHLHLARDYATRAERAIWSRIGRESFGPACWGFTLPSASELGAAIATLEASGERAVYPPQGR